MVARREHWRDVRDLRCWNVVEAGWAVGRAVRGGREARGVL